MVFGMSLRLIVRLLVCHQCFALRLGESVPLRFLSHVFLRRLAVLPPTAQRVKVVEMRVMAIMIAAARLSVP